MVKYAKEAPSTVFAEGAKKDKIEVCRAALGAMGDEWKKPVEESNKRSMAVLQVIKSPRTRWKLINSGDTREIQDGVRPSATQGQIIRYPCTR